MLGFLFILSPKSSFKANTAVCRPQNTGGYWIALELSSLSTLTVTGRFNSQGMDKKRGKTMSDGEISGAQGSVGKIPSILSAHKSKGKMQNIIPVARVDL